MPDRALESPDPGEAALRVGRWTVEPTLNRVSAGIRSVKLEPKAMALLRHLAERPGQVVSREALLAAVWPGVIVSDDSLTQAVIKLRKALGDTADAPAYIQTIAKGGYRLVAPVERIESAADTSVTNDPPFRTGRGRRLAPWLAAAAALLAAAAVAIWSTRDRVSPQTVAIADVGAGVGASVQTSRAAQPTIRVIPFQAIGGDSQAMLLAQGMTADLVTDLSKVFGLSVIADTLAGPQPNAARSTDAMAAKYVVSGSVQRFDDRLRLQVHLAEAPGGKQLWAERFDRPTSSLFALQDEIVPRLLQVLPAKVSEAELRRLAHRHTRDLEAYELYQRGRIALLARQRDRNEQAREMFRRATELDPAFALAYAALAQTYAADHRNQWTANPESALQHAWDLAQTAHKLDPDVRETYWVLAFVHLERGRHEAALEQLQAAVRLYPSFADAYAFMGGIHAYLGEPAQTLPLMRTAMQLNPDAGYLYYLILGRAHYALGELDQARIHLQRASLRNPANLETRVYAAAVHVAAGNKAEAAWEAEEIRAIQPDFSIHAWLATHPLRDKTTQAKLVKACTELGL